MTNAYPLLTWNEEGEEYTLPTDALQGKDVLLLAVPYADLQKS